MSEFQTHPVPANFGYPEFLVDIILQFSLRVYGDATWRRMFGLLNY